MSEGGPTIYFADGPPCAGMPWSYDAHDKTWKLVDGKRVDYCRACGATRAV